MPPDAVPSPPKALLTGLQKVGVPMGLESPTVQVPGKVFSKPSVKMVVDWADAPWMPRKRAATLRNLISEFDGGVEFMGLDRLEMGGRR